MQLLPKSDNPDTLPPKQAVFRCFSGQTVDVRLLHVIHIWKAMTLNYNLAYLETILVYPTRRQSFHSATACIEHKIWHLVLRMQIEFLYSLAAYRVTRRASFGTLCPPCGMIYRAIRLPYLWYWPSFVQPVLISTPFSTYFVHIFHAPYKHLQIPVCVLCMDVSLNRKLRI